MLAPKKHKFRKAHTGRVAPKAKELQRVKLKLQEGPLLER